jgi:hypothetical protein
VPPSKAIPVAAVAQPDAVGDEQPEAVPAPATNGIMQRLGPIGIVLLAVMAGAIAWLVSSYIK